MKKHIETDMLKIKRKLFLVKYSICSIVCFMNGGDQHLATENGKNVLGIALSNDSYCSFDIVFVYECGHYSCWH